MPDPTTRRTFFGPSAGAALFCTIGGEEVRLDDPDAAGKADALAAQVKRPPAPEDKARKWQSEPASSGYRYKRTFRKAGRYRIICTLHEEMTMTIRVKR